MTPAPQSSETLRIVPMDHEPTRYWVQSRSRPDMQHLVDSDYDGAFACSCEDHMVRNRECPHIRAVRAHLKANHYV